MRELAKRYGESQGNFIQRLHETPEKRRQREGMAALEREMMQEVAASLGRAEERIVRAFEAMACIAEEIDELEAQARDTSERVAAFNEQRDLAERRLWELTIQREALGLIRHDELEKLYPLPPRRR